MEKENKKARDDARKEYNDTVRVCRPPSNINTTLLRFSSLLLCLFENETHGIRLILRPTLILLS